jgi:hypothetical protein
MTSDADNQTDFDTRPVNGQYDVARSVTFALKLADQEFAGETTATSATKVTVTPGTLTDPLASEALLGSLPDPKHPVVIRNLRANTAYRVRLAAYAEADGVTAIDTGDAACVTTFATGTSSELSQLFSLKLRDKPSDGAAQTFIALTEGTVEDASGTLELERS